METLRNEELKQEVLVQPKTEVIREFGDIYGLAKEVAEQKAKLEEEEI